jgi:hypothetical protein
MARQSERYPIDYWRPLLPQLKRLGIEMDQRMQQAWEMCASSYVTEVRMLTSLLKINSRGLECLPENWLEVGESFRKDPTWHFSVLNPFPDIDRCPPKYAEIAAPVNFPIWMRTIGLAGTCNTITCYHFCRAISETLLTPWQGPAANGPPLIEYLGFCLNEQPRKEHSDFAHAPLVLKSMPRTRRVIEVLGQVPSEPDDFQYALCVEEGNIVFRAFSVLDDFPMRASDGTIIGNRGLLTHFKKQFGAFTLDEIAELEEMIRNPKASEKDFQKYFDAHPHFFRRWDCREVYSQVYLARDEEGPLVPDFILTNPEVQQATILELKLPKPKLVRRQKNRNRFAQCVMEARSQLLEYKDWFEDKRNRERLIGKVKMEIFRPRLAVVIGRSADFRCAIDRQKLAARTSDIEVVTYDDMLAHARRRMVFIGGRAS